MFIKINFPHNSRPEKKIRVETSLQIDILLSKLLITFVMSRSLHKVNKRVPDERRLEIDNITMCDPGLDLRSEKNFLLKGWVLKY